MRILLADDQAKVRSALRLLIEQQRELNVVGEATDADSLLVRVLDTLPDMVLLDWELPGQNTADLLQALHLLRPGLLVIALSGRPEARQEALLAGADAFASKCEPPERLLAVMGNCRRRRCTPPGNDWVPNSLLGIVA